MIKILKNFKKNQLGFGLTELIATVSIIGIVGTVSTAKLDNALAAARDAHRKMNMHQVQTALALYYDDNSSYPIAQDKEEPTIDGWVSMKSILEDQKNPYIANLNNDPINKDSHIYKYWSDGEKFKISYVLEDPEISETQLVLGI